MWVYWLVDVQYGAGEWMRQKGQALFFVSGEHQRFPELVLPSFHVPFPGTFSFSPCQPFDSPSPSLLPLRLWKEGMKGHSPAVPLHGPQWPFSGSLCALSPSYSSFPHSAPGSTASFLPYNPLFPPNSPAGQVTGPWIQARASLMAPTDGAW